MEFEEASLEEEEKKNGLEEVEFGEVNGFQFFLGVEVVSIGDESELFFSFLRGFQSIGLGGGKRRGVFCDTLLFSCCPTILIRILVKSVVIELSWIVSITFVVPLLFGLDTEVSEREGSVEKEEEEGL